MDSIYLYIIVIALILIVFIMFTKAVYIQFIKPYYMSKEVNQNIEDMYYAELVARTKQAIKDNELRIIENNKLIAELTLRNQQHEIHVYDSKN